MHTLSDTLPLKTDQEVQTYWESQTEVLYKHHWEPLCTNIQKYLNTFNSNIIPSVQSLEDILNGFLNYRNQLIKLPIPTFSIDEADETLKELKTLYRQLKQSEFTDLKKQFLETWESLTKAVLDSPLKICLDNPEMAKKFQASVVYLRKWLTDIQKIRASGEVRYKKINWLLLSNTPATQTIQIDMNHRVELLEEKLGILEKKMQMSSLVSASARGEAKEDTPDTPDTPMLPEGIEVVDDDSDSDFEMDPKAVESSSEADETEDDEVVIVPKPPKKLRKHKKPDSKSSTAPASKASSELSNHYESKAPKGTNGRGVKRGRSSAPSPESIVAPTATADIDIEMVSSTTETSESEALKHRATLLLGVLEDKEPAELLIDSPLSLEQFLDLVLAAGFTHKWQKFLSETKVYTQIKSSKGNEETRMKRQLSKLIHAIAKTGKCNRKLSTEELKQKGITAEFYNSPIMQTWAKAYYKNCFIQTLGGLINRSGSRSTKFQCFTWDLQDKQHASNTIKKLLKNKKYPRIDCLDNNRIPYPNLNPEFNISLRPAHVLQIWIDQQVNNFSKNKPEAISKSGLCFSEIPELKIRLLAAWSRNAEVNMTGLKTDPSGHDFKKFKSDFKKSLVTCKRLIPKLPVFFSNSYYIEFEKKHPYKKIGPLERKYTNLSKRLTLYAEQGQFVFDKTGAWNLGFLLRVKQALGTEIDHSNPDHIQLLHKSYWRWRTQYKHSDHKITDQVVASEIKKYFTQKQYDQLRQKARSQMSLKDLFQRQKHHLPENKQALFYFWLTQYRTVNQINKAQSKAQHIKDISNTSNIQQTTDTRTEKLRELYQKHKAELSKKLTGDEREKINRTMKKFRDSNFPLLNLDNSFYEGFTLRINHLCKVFKADNNLDKKSAIVAHAIHSFPPTYNPKFTKITDRTLSSKAKEILEDRKLHAKICVDFKKISKFDDVLIKYRPEFEEKKLAPNQLKVIYAWIKQQIDVQVCKAKKITAHQSAQTLQSPPISTPISIEDENARLRQQLKALAQKSRQQAEELGKRQARLITYKDKLKNLQRDSQRNIQNADEQSQNLQQALKSLDTLRLQLASKQSTLSQYKSTLSTLEKSLAEKRAYADQLEQSLQNIKNLTQQEASIQQEKLRTLEQSIAAIQKQKLSLKQENQQVIAEQKIQNQKIKEQYNESQTHLKSATEKLKAIQKENTQILSQLDAARSENASRIQQLSESKGELEQKLANMSTQFQKTSQKLTQKKADLREARLNTHEMTQIIDQSSLNIQSLTKQSNKLKLHIENLKVRIKKQSADLSKAKTRTKELASERDQLKKSMERAEASLLDPFDLGLERLTRDHLITSTPLREPTPFATASAASASAGEESSVGGTEGTNDLAFLTFIKEKVCPPQLNIA